MIDFQEMARQLVGDGKMPNVFFVTDNQGVVLAVVTTNRGDATQTAVAIGGYLVEDRLEGCVWGNAEFCRLHAAL